MRSLDCLCRHNASFEIESLSYRGGEVAVFFSLSPHLYGSSCFFSLSPSLSDSLRESPCCFCSTLVVITRITRSQVLQLLRITQPTKKLGGFFFFGIVTQTDAAEEGRSTRERDRTLGSFQIFSFLSLREREGKSKEREKEKKRGKRKNKYNTGFVK